MQHAGSEGNEKIAGHPLKAASAIPASNGRNTPLEITNEEIYELIESYGDAALCAQKAGADAVEVHCAHGYLVSSFISQRTNKRIDEFGGCFENRMRLPRLIIENIRKKVGNSLAILCRINSTDDVLGGIDVHDSSVIAVYLEECGVDGLHVSRSIHIHDELNDNKFENEIIDIFRYVVKTSKKIQAKSLFSYNIMLVGFMGVGKSTISSYLNHLLEMERVETDSYIVKQ